MAHTYNDVLRSVTKNILDGYQTTGAPSPDIVEETVLAGIATAFKLENAMRDKGEKWPIPQTLPPVVVAQIMARLYPIYTVCTSEMSSDKVYDLLAIYQTQGKHEGIYSTDEEDFRALAYQYCYTLLDRSFKELLIYLRSMVPRIAPTRAKNLIAVNNGIFDYDTKQLMPFDPKYVFLSKSKVDYNPNAINPVIAEPDGSQWDVESWMQDLSDDPEVVDLLWCIIGAIIRPNVRWNKSAWYYSERGNNGKGTLCELMRQICGEGTCTSIPLAEMGKDFALEPLIRSSAIIVDENDVGTFIDKAANLKAIVTGDVVHVNRKFKAAIPFRFHGFMVQCLNEMPRVKDKSDSFFRRQLFVPFTKTFTGHEKKYIKNDFLHRKDVLEYVLHRVLSMNYYELPEPEACKTALDEYKEYVNPVRAFLLEIMPQVEWTLLPYAFLYDLYVAWYRKTNGSDKNVSGRRSFIREIQQMLPELFPEWEPTGGDSGMRPGNRMNKPEPLIHEYNLIDWMNPVYVKSTSIEKQCRPLLSEKYKGIYMRIIPTVGNSGDPES